MNRFSGSWIRSGIVMWRRLGESKDYFGTTKLRIKWWTQGASGPEVLGSQESDEFILLPPPVSFNAEDPDVVGIHLETGQPHALLNFDYNQDGWEDVFVARVGAQVELYRNQTPDPGPIASFVERAEEVFPPLAVPVDARGLSHAKIHRDHAGEVLFVAQPGTDSHLYQVSGSGGSTTLGDVSGWLPSAARDFVWAASFGDLEPDGDLDLYLARADGIAPGYDALSVSPAEMAGHGQPDMLLVWDEGAGAFVEQSSALPYTTNTQTSGATWFDANGDGYQDIYVSNLGTYDPGGSGAWSMMLHNQGDGSFLDSATALLNGVLDPNAPTIGQTSSDGGGSPAPLIGRIGSVSAAKVLDLEGDGDLDLVLTRRSPRRCSISWCWPTERTTASTNVRPWGHPVSGRVRLFSWWMWTGTAWKTCSHLRSTIQRSRRRFRSTWPSRPTAS